MKLCKSTGPICPLWEPPNRLEGITCEHELGVLWVKLMCAEWLMWTCERELVFQRLRSELCGEKGCCSPWLPTKRLVNATPGESSEACSLELQPGLAAGLGSKLGSLCWGGEGIAFFFGHHPRHAELCWEGVGKSPFGFEESLCKCSWCCLNPSPNYKACRSQRAR